MVMMSYGFVLVKADSSDYQSIIEPDSLYMRVLKLYFDANQMGLWTRNPVRSPMKALKINIRKARYCSVHGPGLPSPHIIRKPESRKERAS